MTDSEKELVTSLRNRAENALQEGTATAQADAWHFTQSADAIETLLAERAAAWVSKCFICDDVDAPREKCLCVSCHVGRERKRAETAERERDEARAELERVMRGLVTVPLLQRAEAAEQRSCDLEAEVARLTEILSLLGNSDDPHVRNSVLNFLEDRAALEVKHD